MTKTVCIVGMARSGAAAARLALSQGHRVRLLELKQDEKIRAKAKILSVLGVDVRVGAHEPSQLDGVDQIVVSPGVPRTSPVFGWAQAREIEVIGELEFSSRHFGGKLIAVTGTNGKTTTTSLIAHLLHENGIPAVACGNIGMPLAQVIISCELPAVAVAEVSSFQMETIEAFHPAISVFLNFTPDHLDRHTSLMEYWLAKLRLYKNQGPGDAAIIHGDLAKKLDPVLKDREIPTATFGLDPSGADISIRGEFLDWAGRGVLCAKEDVPLLGNHNLENACAAAAVASLCGLERPAISTAMRSFRPVDHRLQPVGTVGGIRFINDSKATNVDSLAVALRSFPEKIVLIAGGRDKNQDFTSLRPLIGEKVKLILLLGEGAQKMARQWEGASEILRVHSLKEAVWESWRRAQPQGDVLLSPACASFDMFRDYEHRGREFVRCVQEIQAAQEALSETGQTIKEGEAYVHP